MDILEGLKPGDTFTAAQVAEDKCCNLLAQMSIAGKLAQPELKSIIETWRNEVYGLRNAIRIFADIPIDKQRNA